MKRYFAILTLVLSVAACNKQELSKEQAPAAGEVITAHIGGPDSKVEFDPSSGEFSWSNQDHIAIHTTEGSYKTAEVNSLGLLSFIPDEGEARNGYAVYPAAAASGTAEVPTVTLPSSYDLEAEATGNRYPTPMIAVNDPDDADLWFYHLGAAFHITLNDVPAGTKTIVVNMGTGITGTFAISDLGSKKPFISAGDTPDEVSFVLADALSEAADGLIVNVPLPIGTYPQVAVSAKSESDAVLAGAESVKEWFFPRGRGRKLELNLE